MMSLNSDWLGAPAVLTALSCVQEWECSTLLYTTGAFGAPGVDAFLTGFVQSLNVLFLAAVGGQASIVPFGYTLTCNSASLFDSWASYSAGAQDAVYIHTSSPESGSGLHRERLAFSAQHLLTWLTRSTLYIFPANAYLTTVVATPTWVYLILAVDPILLAAELFFVATICVSAVQWAAVTAGRHSFYDDVATLCKYNNLSLTEIAVTLTLLAGFVFFDIFLSFAEDDIVDTVHYAIFLFIILTFVTLLVGVDVQYFFMISNAGGDFTFRVIVFDLINNLLCALRVFFCWIRYIFYDLQVELVDLTFQYTDSTNEVGLLGWFDSVATNKSNGQQKNPQSLWSSSLAVCWVVVATFLDIASYILQALTGLFKLVIAGFLLWLIVDLFLLRGFAFDESQGLAALRARASRGRAPVARKR